ncbi:MAG TPA: ABC transporter ATP-binding protein [Vicinamibacterales bacterium]|nr:ABC transporter ATP-binding protein [Vicinamibacterales bacterium]
MAAIETEKLTKDFHLGFWRPRPYRALDALTMTVEEGEVFGFLGPNGAGKSTTLKLLMGLIFPTSGTARILGKPVGDLDMRRRIGFLPENPSFYDYLTAEELLEYFAGLSGLRGEERRRRVSVSLDEVGIGGERRMTLRSFSKGMIQRVGVAQALVAEPSVVFLDEPMSGLDPLGRRHLRQLMLRLRDRGCTVFFSSHILADAEALCSQVGIVVQGRLMAIGRMADMVAFELRGWEMVVANLPDATREKLSGRVSMTALSNQRYTLELPPNETPHRLIQTLAADGVEVVSLNPIRTTLEDYFVSMVNAATPRDVDGVSC